MTASQFKEFNDRQEAQIKQKRENLVKAKHQQEREMREECSFSPKQTLINSKQRQKERLDKAEREEKQAIKHAMRNTVVPGLNLKKCEALIRSEDRGRSQNQSQLSSSVGGGTVSSRELQGVLNTVNECARTEREKIPEQTSYNPNHRFTNKPSVVESLTVPVRQSKPNKRN